MVDASDQAVYGSKKTDYRLHYGMNLFTPDVMEMHLNGIKQEEWVEWADYFEGLKEGAEKQGVYYHWAV